MATLDLPPEEEFHLIVDVKQKRPAGMWVQMANHQHLELLDLFNVAAIMTEPSPDLEEMRGTRAQWERFAAQVNGRFA